MLNSRTLKRINDQPKQVNRLPLGLIGVGSLALAALLFVLTSSLLLALVSIAVGAFGVLIVYRDQKVKMTTTLTYDDNLQGDLMARFAAVQEGCEAFSAAEMIWRLSGPKAGTGQRATKGGRDVAPPPAREPARVGLLETPGITTNVPIWGVEAGEYGTVYFFPEAVLLYRNERYEGFSYESLEVSIESAPFYEKEEVPNDVQVLVKPTIRSRLPVVLYSTLEIGFPRGLEVRLLVSSRRAAARFAKAFGVESRKSPRGERKAWEEARRREEDAKSTTAHEDSPGMEGQRRMALAYATLGVRKGASMGEISAAYKELARTHHPDKVANLSEGDREASEQRMKEINAAYTELKQLKRYLG